MEQLVNELTLLDLPSTMWGVHIHPKHEFIGILHINISSSQLTIDKGLLLVEENGGVKTKIFLNGFITYLPDITLDVKLISDLSDLLYSLHYKNVCINSANGEKHPQCLKLIDTTVYSDKEETKYCCVCRHSNSQESTKLHLVTCDEVNSYNPCEEILGSDQNKPKECKHTCSVCNQNCSNEADLVSHKKLHEEPSRNGKSTRKSKKGDAEVKDKQNKEKQGLCNVCGKMFAPGSRIEEHMLTHTQGKPFKCKICSKAFAKNFNLRMHELTHSGTRPYNCNTCGKTYTSSSNLKVHMVSNHSGEKKHVCEICKMAFMYPRYLKLHMMKHTGERPYVCSVCAKKFSRKIHLTVHMRRHTGEKPYSCNVCGRSFTTSGGLDYHKKARHKDSNSS